jgi:hypothetical protein
MAKKTPLARMKNKCVSLAIKLYVEKHPDCELCGKRASTAHHYILQSRSNYLRCDKRNLVAICRSCHYKLHQYNEAEYATQLYNQRGKKWYEDLMADKHKTIKDTIGYWKLLWAKLMNRGL